MLSSDINKALCLSSMIISVLLLMVTHEWFLIEMGLSSLVSLLLAIFCYVTRNGIAKDELAIIVASYSADSTKKERSIVICYFITSFFLYISAGEIILWAINKQLNLYEVNNIFDRFTL